MPQIKIGWAQISITPNQPVYNGGQIYPRIAQYVHDPLTATALALDNGEYAAVMVSLDIMCIPEESVIKEIRRRLSGLKDFDPQCLSLSATHTHTSIQPDAFLFSKAALGVFGDYSAMLPEKPENLLEGEAMNEFLISRIVSVVTEAWTGRKAGAVATESDYAAVAFNRRPVFKDGDGQKSVMYGVCARDSFLRYEGGSDHSADMIFTYDGERQLTGVAVCIPCPSQVFELHSFLSADYWHYTREALRKRFGNIFVLPLCGAAGDQNPLDLTRISKCNVRTLEAWGAQAGEVFRNFDMADVCRDIADRITDAVSRAYRKAGCHIETQPVFIHKTSCLSLPIRQVSERDYLEALDFVNKEKAALPRGSKISGAELVRIFEPMGVIGRYLQQREHPNVDAPMHFWRIGRAALVSCPFELFVEFSFRIKARAASQQTIVIQMTDGYLDYLPTKEAVAGGSYSSAPASTTCGPECGEIIVENAIAQIKTLCDAAL